MARSKSTLGHSWNSRSPEEWAEKFNEIMAVQRRTVFEIGEALLLAEQELSKKDFATAIKMSGLKTKTTANNYMRVAESEVLKNRDLQKHLPTGVGTLIDLAAWTKEEFALAVKEGALHPNAQRGHLRQWKQKNRYRAHLREDPVEVRNPTPPADALIVGYIKADGKTWSSEKWQTLYQLYLKMADELNLNDVVLTLWEDGDNSISQHRDSRIRATLLGAFKSEALFKDDPFFNRYWTSKGEVEADSVAKDIREIARYISTADYKPLHRMLGFSKDDWSSLGVDNPGSSTITPFLEDQKEAKKKGAKKGQ